MKNHLFLKEILFLLVFSMFFACSNDRFDELLLAPEESKIVGTWKLIEIIDNDDNNLRFSPEGQDFITINFSEDNRYKGITTINEFFGNYAVTEKALTFIQFATSEAGEPPWGQLLYDSMRKARQGNNVHTFNYSISENYLTLEFSESEFLLFEKQ